MTGSAAKGAESSQMKVVSDLDQRLAKFRRIEMTFDSTGLTVRERKMVEKLVDACRYLEDIYWRQSDPDGLELYQSLANSKSSQDEKLRRYLWINGSRFDLLLLLCGVHPLETFLAQSEFHRRRRLQTASQRHLLENSFGRDCPACIGGFQFLNTLDAKHFSQ